MVTIKNVTPTVDIIGSLFAEFLAGAEAIVKEWTIISGSEYRIDTCDTGWITLKTVLQIGGEPYTVKSIVQGESITILDPGGSGNPVLNLTFPMPNVNYFHNTRFGQRAEVGEIPDINDRVPMFWLYEVFEETFNNDDELVLDRTSPLRLFFLDNSNFEDWNNDEHYTFIINPMLNLAESFIEFLKNNPRIQQFEQHLVTSHKNFGEVSDSGHVASYLGDEVSGVQVRITLPIDKDLTCNDCIT